MAPLSGKTALITGASAPRGIGRAIALRLAGEGAAVAVTDRPGILELDGGPQGTMELLAALVAEIVAGGGRAVALPLDVTDPPSVESAVAATAEALGGLDILVNNAGSLAGTGPFLDTTPAQWEASFRVNLLGPMMLCHAAIPLMRQRGGGRIVMIGSTGSLGADAGFGAYTAMKHGLVGLTKTLAAEFGPENILCNLVAPGFIATDMHEAATRRLAAEEGLSVEAMRVRRYATVAQRSAGRPEDVAAAVAYLAGPTGNYVTGISLPVAGGLPFGL